MSGTRKLRILLLGTLLGSGPALFAQPPEPLPAAVYVDALEQLADRLSAGEIEEGRRRAAELLGARIAFGDEVLAPDASILGPAAALRTPADAMRQAPRVRALARSLRESSAAQITPAGRPEQLARLSARETVEKGGEVARLELKPLSLPEQIARALGDAVGWGIDALERLWNWLSKLWPKASRGTVGDVGTTTTVVTVVVALAVVGGALLAYRALRRSRGRIEPTESSVLERSARDEDPLSREAGEWERFAQELAAAGRTREAIRAWYHAVLVTLFRAGALHYEKGRTNWEYVGRLGPELHWRPSFIELTRWFDEQWYGRDRASPDALRESAQAARGILRALRGAESAS